MNKSPLVIQRVLSATPEEAFTAWTEPTSLSVWMCPAPGVTAPVVEIDLRVGGEFRIDMKGEQGVSVHTGRYREITPPSRLVFTWRSSATKNRDTLVTVELTAHSRGVELTLTHVDLPDAQSQAEHRSGWTHILESLADWLKTA